MKVRLARRGGFCMGVRRAVDMALDLQRSSAERPIVTYGPLIHNPQTLQILKARGIGQADSIEEINGGTVIIRAHGISPQEKQDLQAKGVGIIDATCPRVSSVQAIIQKHAQRGHYCLIVGDEDHPEVKGLVGFAYGRAAVISSANREIIEKITPKDAELCVVAQTTQEVEVYQSVVDILSQTRDMVRVFNTICDSTRKRQAEVSRMAEHSELIVVVGGKGSGNTRRLAQVAESHGAKALHVESELELDPESIESFRTVGVTAGASTPNWQIRRVTDRLRNMGAGKKVGFLTTIRRGLDISVMTYVWAAMGGGGLTAACLIMQNRPITTRIIAMTMLFVFSMHLLNRVQDRSGATRFNTPEIAEFYANHRMALVILGLLSCAVSLILAYRLSLNTFLMIFFMTILARVYATLLVSKEPRAGSGKRSFRDIPGSKTPLVAIGWGLATAALPVVHAPEEMSILSLFFAFLFASSLVFWRTEFSDLLDIQGDRIVGRETIPILIGVDRTRKLLKYFLLFLAGIPLLAMAFSAFPLSGMGLLVSVGAYGIIYRVYSMSHLVDRLFFEGIADGVLIVLGASTIALSCLFPA